MAKIFNSKFASSPDEEDFLDDPRYKGPDPYLNLTVDDIMDELRDEVNNNQKMYPIKIKGKDTSGNEKTASGDQESTFDPEDWEQMHPDWEGARSDNHDDETVPWLRDEENRDRIDPVDDKPIKSVCPVCEGDSMYNAPGNETYTEDHCDSCDDKNCGSGTNHSKHCIGCRFSDTSCKGKPQKVWKNGSSCLACHNTGLIDQHKEEAFRGITPSAKEDEEELEGEETNPLHHTDEYLSSMQRDVSGQSFGDDYEDDENVVKHNADADSVRSVVNQFGPARALSVVDDFVPEGQQKKNVGKGLQEALNKDIENVSISKPRYEGQEISTRLDSPSMVSLIEHERSNPLNVVEDDEIENQELPTNEPTYSIETHNPWCKCKGTGQVQDSGEIAKINNSDSFKNGIAEINKKYRGSPDKKSVRDKFILDQYKCKEM